MFHVGGTSPEAEAWLPLDADVAALSLAEAGPAVSNASLTATDAEAGVFGDFDYDDPDFRRTASR